MVGWIDGWLVRWLVGWLVALLLGWLVGGRFGLSEAGYYLRRGSPAWSLGSLQVLYRPVSQCPSQKTKPERRVLSSPISWWQRPSRRFGVQHGVQMAPATRALPLPGHSCHQCHWSRAGTSLVLGSKMRCSGHASLLPAPAIWLPFLLSPGLKSQLCLHPGKDIDLESLLLTP